MLNRVKLPEGKIFPTGYYRRIPVPFVYELAAVTEAGRLLL